MNVSCLASVFFVQSAESISSSLIRYYGNAIVASLPPRKTVNSDAEEGDSRAVHGVSQESRVLRHVQATVCYVRRSC